MLRSRLFLLALFPFAAFALLGDSAIRVVPVSGTATPFRCGDRCKFRANVPAGPLRLRIFRGTINDLAKTGTDVRYVGVTGCVEYYSTIIRTRHPRRPQNVLDLRFYFRPKWLNGKVDGHFVFVVEHDDDPDGPEVEERPPLLRLPAGLAAKYFRSGLDVTIRAPIYATAATRAHTGGETAAMMMPDEGPAGESVVRPAPRPPSTPVTAAENDCLNVQFDGGDPVLIRRAAGRDEKKTKAPVRLASSK
jgi:hypothetical protein